MRAGGKTLLFVCAVLVFIGKGAAFGASSVNSDATVKVKEVFSLAIDSSSIDFGTIRPGEQKEISGPLGYANAAICRSNTGRPWNLSVRATGPLMSDSYTIPLENLGFITTYAGSKNAPYANYSAGLVYQPTEGFKQLSLTDSTIFYSYGTIPDYNTLPNGAEIQFKYMIYVPDTLKIAPGTYRTTIVYTMTE